MKVFGIGFHKTGTSTLDIALKKLGYNVCGVRHDLTEKLFEHDLNPIFKIVDKYDAFQDNPWPILYKELDKRYSHSKFILTLRNEDKWIQSVVNYFGDSDTEMRRWIYGVGHPKGNEEIYLEKYRNHNHEVVEYFKDRKDDLLVVSWENGDGWKELCQFLGKSIPDIEFPHANKGADQMKMRRYRKLKKLLQKLKRLKPFLSYCI
jgi:hypothetical protein